VTGRHWTFPLSGRWLAPLFLLVFSLLAISLRYVQQMKEIDRNVVSLETVRLRERLSVEQGRLDVQAGVDHALLEQRLVSGLALHSGLQRAYLLEPDGRVQASLSRLDMGRQILDVVKAPGDTNGLVTALAQSSRGTTIEVARAAGLPMLTGMVPIETDRRLLVLVDISQPLALRQRSAQVSVMREALMVLGAAALLAMLLHLFWFRRAERVARSLDAMGTGDLAARVDVSGRDELALIGAQANRMAAQLQSGQARIRQMSDIVDRSPVVVIEWRNAPGWPVSYVSDSVAQWGYTPTDLLRGDLTYNDLIHPDDLDRVNTDLPRFLAHGPDHYRMEYRVRCADGHWAWVDDRTSLRRAPDGAVTSIGGILLDITAQKEAEAAQREQAEQVRLFFELPFAGMAISSPADKRWLQVNDRLCDILGYPREQLLRMTWAETTHPDDLPTNVNLFEELVAGRRTGYQMQKRFLRPDGTEVITEIDVRAVHHPDGSIKHLLTTIQDITARIQGERALKQSEELFRHAQRIGHMGSWTYSFADECLTWSEEVYRIFEQDPQTFEPSLDHFFAVVHPDERDRVMAQARASTQLDRPFFSAYRMCMPDGRIKHLRVRGEVEWRDGRMIRSLGMIQDVTDLALAQEALREKESLLAEAQKVAQMGNWMVDPVTREGIWSAGLLRVLGVDPDTTDVDVDRLRSLVHPEDLDRVQSTVRHAISVPPHGSFRVEHRILVNGDVRYIEQRGRAEFDDAGHPSRVFGIAMDITDRKQAEEALRNSEQRYTLAAQIGRSGAWEMWPREGKIFFDGNLTRLLGYEADELSEDLADWYVTVPGYARAGLAAALQAVIEGRADNYQIEHPVQRKDGSTGWLLAQGQRVSPPGQVPLRLVGSSLDITERKASNQVLLDLKDMLEQAEALVKLGSWVGDVDSQRLTISEQLFRNVGLDPSEKVPTDAEYIARIHPQDRNMVVQDMAAIRSGKEVGELLIRTNPDHGPVRTMRRTVRRIPADAEGRGIRYIGTLLDITDAVAAEEQLKRLNQELEQRVAERTEQLSIANQELEAFSYTVSHDLKAPLRGIDGYSQLLVEECKDQLDEDGREFVQRIRYGVGQMVELINDLLEYSRMERRDMALEPVDLLPLVDQVLDVYRSDIESSRTEVRLALDPVTLPLDRDGFMVVLRNLVGNALKFSREVDSPCIEIGGRSEAGRRILWVKDNGVGFDMKYHDRIFGIFQRLHRPEAFPGTGVGLALVSKAVSRMGGRVWAESEPGAGATFFLELQE
jgi:PAS domain S-box-containing protein